MLQLDSRCIFNTAKKVESAPINWDSKYNPCNFDFNCQTNKISSKTEVARVSALLEKESYPTS